MTYADRRHAQRLFKAFNDARDDQPEERLTLAS